MVLTLDENLYPRLVTIAVVHLKVYMYYILVLRKIMKVIKRVCLREQQLTIY